jgi:hypothetical protein
MYNLHWVINRLPLLHVLKFYWKSYFLMCPSLSCRGRRGHDCMVFGYTTTYATSAYHH